MAIYRLEAKIIGRRAKDVAGKPVPGKRVSIVAKAAYRSGEKLKDERADRTFNYRSRAQEVVHTEILTPAAAPEWMHDRARLWNAIEQAERRSDSQLAREFVIALPVELDRDAQVRAVRDWCQEEVVSEGYVADVALHRSKDGANPHAHVLVTLRPVEGDGFGKKPSTAGIFNGRGSVGLGAKEQLEDWRESWEHVANEALAAAGRAERIDHRSLEARGIDQEPQPKIGVAATAMQRAGKVEEPDRVKLAQEVAFRNELLPQIHALERGEELPQASFWQRTMDYMTWLGRQTRDFVRDTWQAYVVGRREVERARAEPEPDGPDVEGPEIDGPDLDLPGLEPF